MYKSFHHVDYLTQVNLKTELIFKDYKREKKQIKSIPKYQQIKTKLLAVLNLIYTGETIVKLCVWLWKVDLHLHLWNKMMKILMKIYLNFGKK